MNVFENGRLPRYSDQWDFAFWDHKVLSCNFTIIITYFFVNLAFSPCIILSHGTLAVEKKNSGNDIESPTDLLTINSTECMGFDWLAARWKHAWDSGKCHRARVLCYMFCSLSRLIDLFFLLLFYKGSNRFHHLKEFPYNYEGETISSVTGASSARSGLKIRARCVVKSVAPCQHVLKVSFFYRPSKLDAWWLIGVYLLFNHEVVFVSEDSSLWKLVNLDKTTIIEESNLCSQSSVLE